MLVLPVCRFPFGKASLTGCGRMLLAKKDIKIGVYSQMLPCKLGKNKRLLCDGAHRLSEIPAIPAWEEGRWAVFFRGNPDPIGQNPGCRISDDRRKGNKPIGTEGERFPLLLSYCDFVSLTSRNPISWQRFCRK